MRRITTILGDISPRDLGLTSFHEHILADMCRYTQELFDKLMRENPARILAHE